EHRLACRRIGVELTARRRDLLELRRRGLGPRSRLADPAAAGVAGGEQLAVAGGTGLHDQRDPPDRAHFDQLSADLRIDLARHRIAAVGRHRADNRLDLALAPVTQVAVDEALGLDARLAVAERHPRPAPEPVEPSLDLVDLTPEPLDRRLRGILPRDDVERLLEHVGFGIDIHKHHLPSATKKPPEGGDWSQGFTWTQSPPRRSRPNNFTRRHEDAAQHRSAARPLRVFV